MRTLSKTAQVLKYFAQHYGRPGIPRTRLGKCAFMADVIARQYLAHPITELVYRKDFFGPYARELPKYTTELVEAELVNEVTHGSGDSRAIRLHDRGHPVAFGFTPGEAEVLAYVSDNYLDMDLEEFVQEVVKKTEPFKTVHKHGDQLPMEVLDGVVRDAVGFDLEKLIRAEKQAETGEGITLDQFADELHSRFAS
ncbi:MAG: hypothetical protein ACREPM_18295 [Gemmatimonadaceae bacterium]